MGMKGDINTYRMVRVPCRLMHWVTLFGPFLGPNFPKTDTLLICSKTAPAIFFKLGIRMEDINTYQMAKTPSKLIHLPRSYSSKTGVMTSSFGPNSADWSW